MAARILVNDDEAAITHALQTLLAREGYEVTATRSCEAALACLRQDSFALLVSDIMMRPMNGIDLLREARLLQPRLPVILITGMGSAETAAAAMFYDAFDYLCKPFRIADLVAAVQRALTACAEEAPATSHRDAIRVKLHAGELVGESAPMQTVYRLVEHLAASNDTILILGDEGTEKEAVARAIHASGTHRDSPFVRIACGDLAEAELDRVLFGHAGGRDQTEDQGVFFRHPAGTVLLDDIHLLPMALQRRLPHFLRKLARFRGDAALAVRVVISSAELLEDAVLAERFDHELYRLLNPVTIELPRLTDRLEDLPALVAQILDVFAAKTGRRLAMAPGTWAALELYDWPENIAELSNLVNRAAARCESARIEVKDLPEPLRGLALAAQGETSAGPHNDFRWRALRGFMAGREDACLEALLRLTQGDQARAAAIMGLPLAECEAKLAKTRHER